MTKNWKGQEPIYFTLAWVCWGWGGVGDRSANGGLQKLSSIHIDSGWGLTD